MAPTMTQLSGNSSQRQRLLQKKLRNLMLIPAVLGLVQLALALVDIAQGGSPALLLLLLIPAFAVGYPFGRRTRLDPNTDTGEIGMVGGQGALTIAFLVLIVTQKLILKRALGGLEGAATIVLIVTVGLIYGRLFGLYQQIRDAMSRRSAS